MSTWADVCCSLGGEIAERSLQKQKTSTAERLIELGITKAEKKCPACAKGTLMSTMVQIRSGDEAMTQIVRCKSCQYKVFI